METVELREALAAGRGEILDLSHSRHVRPRPPDLMIGAVTPALMRAYFTESLVHGAAVLRVREAEVLREGAVLLDGRFALCGQINVDPGYPARFHPDLAERRPTLPLRRIAEEVVLLAGAGHTVYGHWLADFLPKLYLLHRAGYRLERLRILLPDDTPAFARAWLAALGIEAGQILPYAPWGERLACAQLVVPGALRHASRAAPMLAEARTFLLDRLGYRRPRWRPAPRPRRRLLVARSENPATLNRRRLAERALLAERAAGSGS
ncbi:glycosyltransferase family 61 protein, partial [Methylobacterium dankookense]|uniref:glycosyltransferase family 61 protein n=1 Tax=Methylobacterium dankookense TaxID=560405 RepID=UPI001EE072D9